MNFATVPAEYCAGMQNFHLNTVDHSKISKKSSDHTMMRIPEGGIPEGGIPEGGINMIKKIEVKFRKISFAKLREFNWRWEKPE